MTKTNKGTPLVLKVGLETLHNGKRMRGKLETFGRRERTHLGDISSTYPPLHTRHDWAWVKFPQPGRLFRGQHFVMLASVTEWLCSLVVESWSEAPVWVPPLIPAWPWENYLISLCFSFFNLYIIVATFWDYYVAYMS